MMYEKYTKPDKVCDKPVMVAVEEFKDHKYIILEPDVDD